MLRKSVFILVLLCSLAVANSAMAWNWSPNASWGGSVDANWFDPGNWTFVETGASVPPDLTTHAIIAPYQAVQPVIDGDASCSALNVSPWGWSGSVETVTLNSGSLITEAIMLAAGGDFAPDINGLGQAILYVNSGTITMPMSGATGITLGRAYNYTNYGRVVMNGGLVSVPSVTINHGDIALYGGTLEVNELVFNQNWPQNKIDISGGTLRILGDQVAALNALKTSGRIYSARGTIGTPALDVLDPNFTILTSSDVNMAQAHSPSPANSATEVHYRVADVNVGVTLTWSSGDEPNVIKHDVYFGTNANIVNSVYGDANYKGTVLDADGRTYGLDDVNYPAGFKVNTSYYWRVDEVVRVSDELDVNGVVKGDVWTFKTHNGNAYNPNPISGATALSEPLALSWTAGDFAASTNGHKVYFATGSNLLNATLRKTWTTADSRYRGQQSGTSYSLAKLAGAFTLVPGSTYYWCVDEVNGTSLWQGPIWSFTAADYVTVDDFEDYNTSAEVQANWDTAYDSTCYYPVGNGSVALVQDAAGKHMSYHYSNLSGQESSFTEIRRSYNPGTSFTGSGALVPATAALRVDYIGSSINGADEVYDRMYVALQDTAGNIGIVMNPDGNAATVGVWTSWFVSLNDFKTAPNPTALKLTDVNAFMLGFGIRCDYGTVGGDGNMMFDNIRLYAQTCNPDYAYDNGMLGDLNRDCSVDINDLDAFASDWLKRADVRTYTITQPSAPVLWYKFDESGITTDVVDSGTGDANDYAGAIVNFAPLNWKPEGRDGGGCLNLPSGGSSYVSCPVSALGFWGDDAHSAANGGGGITFAFWVNADLTAPVFGGWVYGFIDIPSSDGNSMSIACPHHYNVNDWSYYGAWAGWNNGGDENWSLGPGVTGENYGTRWNHWAFVKSPTALQWYCNGTMIRQELVTDANNGDPNIDSPLFTSPTAFTIGNSGWAGYWAGRVDDFQVYDSALSAEEVAYLATDGTGTIVIPINLAANMVAPGTPAEQVVNFADLAEMCTEWRQTILWP